MPRYVLCDDRDDPQDGFIVKDTSGIVGEPVFRSWRIDPNCTQVNYILCAHKPQY